MSPNKKAAVRRTLSGSGSLGRTRTTDQVISSRPVILVVEQKVPGLFSGVVSKRCRVYFLENRPGTFSTGVFPVA